MMYKELLSALAIAITFIAFIPYISSILKNKTQPHAFSWIVWGSVTFIIFLAQLSDGGGAGAWPIGVSGVITLFVAILAYLKKSDHMIVKKDWVFFILAMSAIPFWYITSNPLWAVIILTAVDLLGFVPTFRKAYSYPGEEQLTFFVLISCRNIIAAIALEHYSVTTLLFPVATALACILFIQMVVYRRRQIIKQG